MDNNTDINNNNKLHRSNLLQMDERHPSINSTIAQQNNTLLNAPIAIDINTIQTNPLPILPNVPPISTLYTPMIMPNKQLNPNANTFTPSPQSQLLSVQGYNQPPTVQQQLDILNKLVQQSLIKLQLLSEQLNQLNLVNQQSKTLESLQQYQSVYQQYQIEFTTCLILSQSIANLTNFQQPKHVVEAQPVPVAQQQPSLTPPAPPQNEKLAPIEEGEEQEDGFLNDQPVAEIAAVNSVPHTPKIEGLDITEAESREKLEQKNDIEVDGEAETETKPPQTTPTQPKKYSIKIKNFYEKNKNKEGIQGDEMRYGKEYVLKKRIRGILNKITPENFDKLSQEIVSIIKAVDLYELEQRRADGEVDHIASENDQSEQDSEEMKIKCAKFKALIKLIIGCILDKSINDEKYSNEYARLCYSLYLKIEYDEMKKKIFRSQLVGRCHSIFKKARKNQDNQRFIGIITMIGELFTYGLISWKIISSGIFDELLPPKTAMDIKVICELLKTSGNDFDKHHYDEVDETIKKLKTHSQNYDFLTKCLVKEIYEMRQNEWRQREDIAKESPKTLNQIKKEFHEKNGGNAFKRPSYNGYDNRQSRTRFGNHDYQRPPYYKYGYTSRRNQYGSGNSSTRWGRTRNSGYNGGNKRGYIGRGKSLRPTVEFVKDVTLPDRSHYPANKVLTKTWKMRNSGELSWGDNVELVYFKGHERLSLEHRYPVINAAPEEEVEISATIRTPRQPGRYCTYFRLQKNGKFFGPRVWVDIIVATNLPSDSPRDGRKNSATSNEAHKSQMVTCAST